MLRRSLRTLSCWTMELLDQVSLSRSTLAVSSSRSLPMLRPSPSASWSPLAASPPSPCRFSPRCPKTQPGPPHFMFQSPASSSSILGIISAGSSLDSSSGPNLERSAASSPFSSPLPGLIRFKLQVFSSKFFWQVCVHPPLPLL